MISKNQLFKVSFYSNETLIPATKSKDNKDVNVMILTIKDSITMHIQQHGKKMLAGYTVSIDGENVCGAKIMNQTSEFTAINDHGKFKKIVAHTPQFMAPEDAKKYLPSQQIKLYHGIPNFTINFYQVNKFKNVPEKKQENKKKRAVPDFMSLPIIGVNPNDGDESISKIIENKFYNRPLTLAGGDEVEIDTGYKGRHNYLKIIDFDNKIDTYVVYYFDKISAELNGIIDFDSIENYHMMPNECLESSFKNLFLSLLDKIEEKEGIKLIDADLVRLYFKKTTGLEYDTEIVKNNLKYKIQELIDEEIIYYKEGCYAVNEAKIFESKDDKMINAESTYVSSLALLLRKSSQKSAYNSNEYIDLTQ